MRYCCDMLDMGGGVGIDECSWQVQVREIPSRIARLEREEREEGSLHDEERGVRRPWPDA
jgi:hypothetical protein